MNDFSPAELKRYDRQILLEEVGAEGQRKLRKAKIVVVGLGGLGSSVSFYLAAAGIGCLRLIDCDSVDATNLNRQILHWEKDLGRRKVETAFEKLSALNPGTKIEVHDIKLSAENYREMFSGCDLAIDCLDNFETRYLLNRAAIEMNFPFIHGACRGFEGRISLIVPGKTPCLGCFVPVPPEKEIFPILGATAGFVGSLQAMQAVKFLVQAGNLLENRLLIVDGKSLLFRIIELEKDPDCRFCGKGAKR